MPGFLLTRMELPGHVALLALLLCWPLAQRLSLGPSCSPFYYLLHEVGIRRMSRVLQQRWSEGQISQSTLRVHPDPFPLTLTHISCLKLEDPSLFALTGIAALCHGAVTQFKSARPRRVWGFVELGTGPDTEREPS